MLTNRIHAELLSSILNAHRASSKLVQIKMIIGMSLEPKHKNFKDEYKIKGESKKF